MTELKKMLENFFVEQQSFAASGKRRVLLRERGRFTPRKQKGP